MEWQRGLLAFSAALILLLVIIGPFEVSGWNIALNVTTNPSSSFGGSKFLTQPVVAVNNKKGELQQTIKGRITVQAETLPNNVYEPVWKEGEPLPTEDSHTFVSVTVENGLAIFSGLGIDTSGERYRLKFVFYDEHEILMGIAVSEEFTVKVGEIFQLGVVTQPETAYGGAVFGSQPIVGIQDRGGNIVRSVNMGMVSVTLQSSPSGSTLRCMDEGGFNIVLQGGLAIFRDLYINEAGMYYSLRFSTDLLLSGRTEVDSSTFSVGVGDPAEIVLIKDASDGSVLGGKAFLPQPKLEMRDAGGNLLLNDSSSVIRVSIYSNPSQGKLSSHIGTTGILHKGSVQFHGLSIDKAGIGYRLKYVFLRHKDDHLEETSIFTFGSYFNVEIGPPTRLSILRHSSGAWAGNQPFHTQPKLALLDMGGNIVVGDSRSIISAHVTPSLALNSRVVVSTIKDQIPSIVQVVFAQSIKNDERESFGPGDAIFFDVIFSQEIALLQSYDGDVKPQVALNIIGQEIVYSELVANYREGYFTRTLSFRYDVENGHSQIELDYLASDAMRCNSFIVVDAFGRRADLLLPDSESGKSLTASKSISISDNPPIIERIVVDLPAREYGAGEEVNIIVHFDRHVIVTGNPELPLNIRSSILVLDFLTENELLSESYLIILYRGERSRRIPSDASAKEMKDALESIQSVEGDVCVSRAPNKSKGGLRWAIRFMDANDFIADLHVDDSGLAREDVSIATSTLSTNSSLLDWNTDDGDPTMCTTRTASYADGSGTRSLRFSFSISPGDSAEKLDRSKVVGAGLLYSNIEDSIYLMTNSLGTAAIQADVKLKEISAENHVTINTAPPVVVSITPQATPNGSYAVGDTLFFEVLFDKPVEVEVGLELMFNSRHGVARYTSGSGTETLVLQYTVEMGDTVLRLDYRDSKSLVAQNTEGGRSPVLGYVRRTSTRPVTDAILDLSHLAAVTHNIEIDGEPPRLVRTYFSESQEGKSFVKGDLITIFLEFSSPVVVFETAPPILGLLVGVNERWAKYLSGSGSCILRFTYRVIVGDSAAPPDFHYRRLCHQNGDCTSGKGLLVRQSATLELDIDLITNFSENGIRVVESSTSGVTIDTSMSPATTVLSTTTSKPAGIYGAGEIVLIEVAFTDPVVLHGTLPKLLMNTGHFATYYAPGNAWDDTDKLLFRYISSESDTVSSLEWALDPTNHTAIICSDSCAIQNANGVRVDVKFHDVGSLNSMVAFNASPPRIVTIATNKTKSNYCHPICSYTVGEEIEIYVRFDFPVSVEGTDLSLAIDVRHSEATQSGPNVCAIYTPSRSSEIELVFLYTVGHGHLTTGTLNYICSEDLCSLLLGDATEVKRAASVPTIDADLILPPPSEYGLSGNDSNPIIIDTIDLPIVTAVVGVSPDGVYSPGDSIEISVQFSRTVVLSGEAFLVLDMGAGQALATYKSGNWTSSFLFEFFVELDHTTMHLEYIDPHSLLLGSLADGDQGYIKQASSNPTINADLTLPFPGSSGSLGATSSIQIDNRTPFITLVSSVSGQYSTGDRILIQAHFSRPVAVMGTPSLNLRVGSVQRIAEYNLQTNGTTIEFFYVVQLGDTTESLDYWSDEELYPSSSASLLLNGGWIKLKATTPVLDADLHINPVDGFLDGDISVGVSEGVALYRDLKIGQRGKDFKIWFSCTLPSIERRLQVFETIQIGASIKYQVQGDLKDRHSGDLYGSALSIHNGLLAVGAPGKLNPTAEVQVLTVYSESAFEEREVQIVATNLNRSEAIISTHEFSTCAHPGETIGGTFTLAFKWNRTYAFAAPIRFQSSVTADHLKANLEQFLNLGESIETSREVNTCGSFNSWTWRITFYSSEWVGVFETNGDFLTGNGADVSQPRFQQHVDVLRGSFKLTNPINGQVSRNIPYNASSELIKDVIQEDLDIGVMHVQAVNDDSENAEFGRRWIVIFSHHDGEYGHDTNVPQLVATFDELIGKDSLAWTHTGFDGRGVLGGSFALSFRGSGPSIFTPYNSSEAEIAAALESLDSINKVTVSSRRQFTIAGKTGFSWTITFNSVNKLTDYGWLADPGGISSSGNLPALEITSHLLGYHAGFFVRKESGKGAEDTQANWMEQKKGDAGFGSGAVDVFRKVRESWRKEATLLASDNNSHDAFGASVSVSDEYLLVGAPSKEVNGLPEQQLMTCLGPATGGYFSVSFRGFKSSKIPFNATISDMQYSVVGFYGETNNIHSSPRLHFASWSEGWDGISSGFCDSDEKSIAITFLTPDGGGISTMEKRSGDLEMLTVDATYLKNAIISVAELRPGTVAPMGTELSHSHSTGKQSGAAYLFRRSTPCSFCDATWSETKIFTPMNGFDDPTDAAEFGSSTKLVYDHTRPLAIIGSPGHFFGSGKVYIFTLLQGSWLLKDSLTDENWNLGKLKVKGGMFGSSLDADSDTILIGAPGYDNEKGAVYVFRRSDRGLQPFLASQAIYGPEDVSEGDRFGHSLSLSGRRAVICAPYKIVGTCFVYSRVDNFSPFILDQKLVPSNIISGDRFGLSVAMTTNRVIVGQVEKFTNDIEPPRSVQVIKTFCEHVPCGLGNESRFRLRWVDRPHWTPFMPSSISANGMRDVIESELLSTVDVSRTVSQDENGGYEWRVTFDSYDYVFRDVNNLLQIECEAFITSRLSCKSHIESDIPRKVRGKAHLFDYDESVGIWTEQSFLLSTVLQKQDMLGTVVAIDGNIAVSGAPNREHLNINSGAAFIYDTRFLNLNFPDGPYSLTENDDLYVRVERSTFDDHLVVSMRTMDANAEKDFQLYIAEIFSMKTLDTIANDKTAIELLTGNSAMRQGNGFLKRRMYDMQGVNDYEPMNFDGQFKPGERMISTPFKVIDDDILESPDEQVTIQIHMRGMFASQLGRLTTAIKISDNGDGGNQYQILDGRTYEAFARFGVATDIDQAAGMMVVGSDQTTGVDKGGNNNVKNVGSARIYKKTSSGLWQLIQTILPSPHETKSNMYFGQSVVINKPYGRDDVTVLIGAPGIASAFVYSLKVDINSFSFQAKLTPEDAPLSSDARFGGQGAIALNGDMAFVGSSTMEQVYVFRRSYVVGEGYISWASYSILRSSDFDYDVWGHGFSDMHVHQQDFGVAVAASYRTLIVGAPYANYGNRGEASIREHFDTNGIHNKGLGKGVVYSFFSQPHIQVITLESDEMIMAGSFVLKLNNHQGIHEDVSGYIPHNAEPGAFKLLIEEMMTVGEVNVETSEVIASHLYKKSWRITFLSNFDDIQPRLIPTWFNHGCNTCERFTVSILSTVEPFVSVKATHVHQPFKQEGTMQPRDVTSTDLFGTSIAVDGVQAIIGSMNSAAKTRTTWDFETGALHGWSSTGNAFQYQPTYGDNSKFRSVYEGHGRESAYTTGEPQSANLEGRYYIGTFEKRSGNAANFQAPDTKFSLGSFQGDEPTGTLTSDPFIILGKSISFLISGGCDHKTVYVELLIDGYPSLRATGKCNEKLERIYWDVEIFKARAAQIRIVDNSGTKWGHINVDDINFSWEIGGSCQGNNWGQCAEGGGALPKMTDSWLEKQHFTGREESPLSGSAYMFRYECGSMEFDDLSLSNTNCVWKEQERLVPSDKRAGNLFGISVAVDNVQGIAIVGSSSAPAYGFHQEPIAVHPYSNSTFDAPISEDLEDLMKSGGTYTATGGNLRLIDYLMYTGRNDVEEARKFTEEAGSVYIFLRDEANAASLQGMSWRVSELAKISPPGVRARDHFGSSIAIDGTVAVMGATGRDSHAENGGNTYVYDMEWVRVKFSSVEFVVMEGQRVAKIFIERDLSLFRQINESLRYSIAYSTSDLTARGVDTATFDRCMTIPASLRFDCGDYEESSGKVTFNPGEQQTHFEVRIMDDKCTERHLEYVQLNLHQLGGSLLHGENFRAQLRIDDDDMVEDALSRNCSGRAVLH